MIRGPGVARPVPRVPAGIVTALTWPASLLTVASVIDNPWGVCLHRSAEVGKHLAQILLRRQQVGPSGASRAGKAQRGAARCSVGLEPHPGGGEGAACVCVWGGFLARQKAIAGERDSALGVCRTR